MSDSRSIAILAVAGLLVTSLCGAAETDPVPPGQLTPGVAIVGPDATETYGSVGTTWSGTPRERGNLFSVSSPANITQIEWYLTVPSTETIYFVIYRKTNDGTVTGVYDQVFITSVSTSTSGAEWVSSGAISYTLDPAYYYYLSVAWDTVSCTYYRGTETTPFATGFGQLLTGIPAGSGHAATWDNTYNTGGFPPYYQRLTFDIVPVELQSLSVE
ncbi:MAG: hypothetical protein MUC56_17250 [Thermoanaerobaculales bacterium]|jgi:hypothetical protein|nr:hypothetical protein [Thermoanaerobaculales bacterium]